MNSLTTSVQVLSVSISLLASGGIAAYTFFAVPLLQSQPASRALPSIRWLFSRGSHIFPTTAALSTAGFTYLALAALPTGSAVVDLLRLSSNSTKVNGYLAAGILNLAIAPWTAIVMVPTNFKLIEINEAKGGARSERSARERKARGEGGLGSAEESVAGQGQASQFMDLSGPQERTKEQTSEKEDREVRELLGTFAWMNAVRALSAGLGGMVGLWSALA